jgi:hypothetical protein
MVSPCGKISMQERCRIYVKDDPAKAKMPCQEASPFTDQQYEAFAAAIDQHPHAYTSDSLQQYEARWAFIEAVARDLQRQIASDRHRANLHGERITTLEDRLNQAPDDPCPPAPPAPKRIIKGGWVNVYRGDYNGAHIDASKRWANKGDAEADTFGDTRERIACIFIPNITEGEGL